MREFGSGGTKLLNNTAAYPCDLFFCFSPSPPLPVSLLICSSLCLLKGERKPGEILLICVVVEQLLASVFSLHRSPHPVYSFSSSSSFLLTLLFFFFTFSFFPVFSSFCPPMNSLLGKHWYLMISGCKQYQQIKQCSVAYYFSFELIKQLTQAMFCIKLHVKQT